MNEEEKKILSYWKVIGIAGLAFLLFAMIGIFSLNTQLQESQENKENICPEKFEFCALQEEDGGWAATLKDEENPFQTSFAMQGFCYQFFPKLKILDEQAVQQATQKIQQPKEQPVRKCVEWKHYDCVEDCGCAYGQIDSYTYCECSNVPKTEQQCPYININACETETYAVMKDQCTCWSDEPCAEGN